MKDTKSSAKNLLSLTCVGRVMAGLLGEDGSGRVSSSSSI